MRIIGLVVYIIMQVLFIPFTIIGLLVISYRQIVVSKRLGVSATAVSAIGNKWLMDVFGIRKDREAVALYQVLPNGSTVGLWLLFFPAYLRYLIAGNYAGFPFLRSEGKEGGINVPSTRTVYFDMLIDRYKGSAEQFVVLGAGFDTRCYGSLKKRPLKLFEVDQRNTQVLKIACLAKANLDASAVAFAEVDFSSGNWYDKLENAGYDAGKSTIFLWEGVTIYLSENDVRKTLTDIKQHAPPGTKILMDLYAKRALRFKGLKPTNEPFIFGLDFSANALSALKTFVESTGLELGDHYFMGHKTKLGPLGVVVEVIV